MTKSYVFDVKMTCGGCSGAVSRALGKMDGIDSYEVNLEKQSVVVRPKTATYDEVFEKIKKTGKEIRSGKEVDEASEEAESSSAAGPAEVVA
ncbi:Cytosolic copper metallochaperone [Serendipita sp. 399]|nr:Cytosolic copper metallochaperone [Serendipita sp. 399]